MKTTYVLYRNESKNYSYEVENWDEDFGKCVKIKYVDVENTKEIVLTVNIAKELKNVLDKILNASWRNHSWTTLCSHTKK